MKFVIPQAEVGEGRNLFSRGKKAFYVLKAMKKGENKPPAPAFKITLFSSPTLLKLNSEF